MCSTPSNGKKMDKIDYCESWPMEGGSAGGKKVEKKDGQVMMGSDSPPALDDRQPKGGMIVIQSPERTPFPDQDSTTYGVQYVQYCTVQDMEIEPRIGG